MKYCSIIVIVMLAGVHMPVRAHHSFAAEFDINRRLELKGTVVKMEWINPHSWLHIEVKGAGGRVEPWAVEFGAPNTLFRRGWKKDMVPTGVVVTVIGFGAKDGSRRANAQDVILPDGKKLFAGSSGTGAPYEGR